MRLLNLCDSIFKLEILSWTTNLKISLFIYIYKTAILEQMEVLFLLSLPVRLYKTFWTWYLLRHVCERNELRAVYRNFTKLKLRSEQ
jgi:hypothetical protein